MLNHWLVTETRSILVRASSKDNALEVVTEYAPGDWGCDEIGAICLESEGPDEYKEKDGGE